MSDSSDPDPDPKELKRNEWERHLATATSLDQVKSVIENCRADESALDPDPNGNAIVVAMMGAVETGDMPLIKYLLEQGVSLCSSVGLTAICNSPAEKKFEIMELLYQNGWDLNQQASRSGTPILGHCSRDEVATRWMLDHGADPNPNTPAGVSVLNMPAAHGSINTVKLLLERGADPRKGIPLRHAIKRDEDWKEMVDLLLDHGCDINAFNPGGYRGLRGCYPGSILHAAAAQNLYYRIPFLIDKGADLYRRSENGYTPLELAVKRGCEESAAILRDAEKRSDL